MSYVLLAGVVETTEAAASKQDSKSDARSWQVGRDEQRMLPQRLTNGADGGLAVKVVACRGAFIALNPGYKVLGSARADAAT